MTNTIINEIKKLRSERAAIDKKIAELEEKLLISIEQTADPKATIAAEPQATTAAEPQATTAAEPQATTVEPQQAAITTVDIHYLNSVYRLADRLEDDLALGNTKLSSGIKNILEGFDPDDVEESINNMHNIILKYAYGLDSHLSSAEWQLVENFLSNIGYKKLTITTGESIIPYRTFFGRPIGIDGGKTNTIKSIQKYPFIGRFNDGFETLEMKLCGKCVYYK